MTWPSSSRSLTLPYDSKAVKLCQMSEHYPKTNDNNVIESEAYHSPFSLRTRRLRSGGVTQTESKSSTSVYAVRALRETAGAEDDDDEDQPRSSECPRRFEELLPPF